MNLAKAALLLLFALTTPRAALVTPEFQIDAPAEGPSVHSETWPAVAFNGSIYVAAWQSSTNTAPINILGAIRWKKFNAAGEAIAGDHFLSDTQVWNPEIASNGSGFLLVGIVIIRMEFSNPSHTASMPAEILFQTRTSAPSQSATFRRLRQTEPTT